MSDNSVFLPVFQLSLKSLCFKDKRIDYDTADEIKFVELKRNSNGTIKPEDINGVTVVRLSLEHIDQKKIITYQLVEIINDVKYSFFGIPVHKLSQKRPDETDKKKYPISDELASIAHYFYDLRHIFDLVQISKKEFYLSEYYLKKGNFDRAVSLLKKIALKIDIPELLEHITNGGANENVIGALNTRCSSFLLLTA
jgi:hypothetical protein